MATTNDPNSVRVSPSNHVLPAKDPTVPHPPSYAEAGCFYYGIPSRPTLVARSSTEPWVRPTGPEAYLLPKEARPVGLHPLRQIWEDTVGPAIVDYLNSKDVKWTSLDPVRMEYSSESSAPVIVWIGVLPGTLSAEAGVEVAIRCKNILSAHAIDDVHVEIRESQVTRSARPKIYAPVSDWDATFRVREPFSTTLGLPICAAGTPWNEGTGGFFISDPRDPSKIYLVTTRHVVFHHDEEPDEPYQNLDSSLTRRKVLLLGGAAIEKHITAIRTEIEGKHFMVDLHERQLAHAEEFDEERREARIKRVQRELDQAKEAIKLLDEFLAEVSRDWWTPENRVLGHIVLSPPIDPGAGEEGFSEDWAVIEIDGSKIDSTNFVGNAIDIRTTSDEYDLTRWLFPHSSEDRIEFMPETLGHDSDLDPYIMVMKRGCGSGLTVGRLNTMRSFTRIYFNGQFGRMSKEIAVLPRDSESWCFSKPGDSGSAVLDGKGRIVGLLVGGAGSTEATDCSYVTSIHFLLKRMSDHGLEANLSPPSIFKRLP